MHWKEKFEFDHCWRWKGWKVIFIFRFSYIGVWYVSDSWPSCTFLAVILFFWCTLIATVFLNYRTCTRIYMYICFHFIPKSEMRIKLRVFKVIYWNLNCQVKFWDFNSMDSSCRAFRTLQPFECHQIKSIQYSQTGDSVLIAAGNAQVSMLYCRSILLIPVATLWPIYPVQFCRMQPPYSMLTTWKKMSK